MQTPNANKIHVSELKYKEEFGKLWILDKRFLKKMVVRSDRHNTKIQLRKENYA